MQFAAAFRIMDVMKKPLLSQKPVPKDYPTYKSVINLVTKQEENTPPAQTAENIIDRYFHINFQGEPIYEELVTFFAAKIKAIKKERGEQR